MTSCHKIGLHLIRATLFMLYLQVKGNGWYQPINLNTAATKLDHAFKCKIPGSKATSLLRLLKTRVYLPRTVVAIDIPR